MASHGELHFRFFFEWTIKLRISKPTLNAAGSTAKVVDMVKRQLIREAMPIVLRTAKAGRSRNRKFLNFKEVA